jgi:hypothetical protein
MTDTFLGQMLSTRFFKDCYVEQVSGASTGGVVAICRRNNLRQIMDAYSQRMAWQIVRALQAMNELMRAPRCGCGSFCV